jgi:glyoxylase-like metal-dependent hydrolase (beta-lactamase superfamily II)
MADAKRTDPSEGPAAATGQSAETGSTYEVLAVRYASRQTRASDVFLSYHVYGEPDRPVTMDYFFWVLRNAERTIVVDTGYSADASVRRVRPVLLTTTQALQAAQVEPATVDRVVLTHAHFDHIGGVDLFDSSEVIMTRAEYDFWTSPLATRHQFIHHVERADLDHLDKVIADGRMTLAGAPSSAVAPGVELLQLGGHTPGQAVVVVRTVQGDVVLASDAMHYYEEIELDRPFNVVTDLAAMYRGFDQLNEMGKDGAILVAGHDPAVMTRFPQRAGHDEVVRIA